MKQTTVGVFGAPEDAERAIARVHRELRVPNDDISFLYRSREGELREIDPAAINGSEKSRAMNSGLWIGALVGFLVGLAEIVNIARITDFIYRLISPSIEQLLANLGFTSAVGTVALTTLVGVILGLVVGWLLSLLGNSSQKTAVPDNVRGNEMLVAVSAPESQDVYGLFCSIGALDARVYRLSM